MSIITAPPFSLVADSVQDLRTLHENNPSPPAPVIAGVCRYLGSIAPDELHALLLADVAFMPVTFANWKPSTIAAGRDLARKHLAQLTALVPSPRGLTLWLDLEAMPLATTVTQTLIGFLDAWAQEVQLAGLIAGLYVGAGHHLTSDELQHLKVTRYWKGASRLTDRNGNLAEPLNGWCMVQTMPANYKLPNGLIVDISIVQHDHRGRLPTWLAP